MRLPRRSHALRAALVLAVVAGLAAFYLAAAQAHATTINTSKARADQSGYLWDAQRVWANWHGQRPPHLIGERNRMPLYAGFLALCYDPHLADEDFLEIFFEIAKVWNIRLSLALLGVIWLAAAWRLPALLAANLALVVGFGYFVFKAGYAQADLLFYTIFFLAFLAAWRLLTCRRPSGVLVSGAVFGILAGLAHLTKASALPLVLIVLAVTAVSSAVQIAGGLGHQPGDRRKALTLGAVRAAAIALAIVSVAAVIYPYIATSKRVYGRWFYNVNTTFYVWYNDWPEASVGTRAHGDGVGWPTLPAHRIPTARRYLRTHSPETILRRIADGMADIVVRLYRTFWVLKYMGLYLALAAAAIARNRSAFARLFTQYAALAAFLGLYGATYLVATAFYAPISGTGTSRFVLAHVAPLLFTISALLARRPFAVSQWTVLGCTLTMGHLHLLVTVSMGLDLAFAIWPRLMTTYGGF